MKGWEDEEPMPKYQQPHRVRNHEPVSPVLMFMAVLSNTTIVDGSRRLKIYSALGFQYSCSLKKVMFAQDSKGKSFYEFARGDSTIKQSRHQALRLFYVLKH